MQEEQNEILVRYNLAGSLAKFKDDYFEFPDKSTTVEKADELFDIRLQYVERMASVLLTNISIKLGDFDRKVMAVMRRGVAENF